MFSTKGLFSDIPCPHLQNCHIPQCIFSHTTLPIAPNLADSHDNSVTNDAEHADEQHGQRKRRKVEDHSTQSPHPITSSPSLPKRKPALSSAVPSAKSLTALTRPVSPPPLKRKGQNGALATTAPELSAQSSPVSATSQSVLKSPVKNEVLNPRTLKTAAPASYDMRMRLLRALHDQFQRLNTELKNDASDAEEKLVLSKQALIGKALDIEEAAASQPPIYTNIVKNKILAYKRMSVKAWVEEREKDLAAEAAQLTARNSTPIVKPHAPPKSLDTGLSADEELTLLQELYTPITNLQKHGYVTVRPTEQDVAKAKAGVEAAQGWEVCDRCKTRFQVFPDRREEDGAHASGGMCTYHWGKPYLQEKSLTDPKAKREKRYRCCAEAMGDSIGCTQAANHVFKISETKRMASVLQFEKTPENEDLILAGKQQPICIDCEMGYTVNGLELIRLTATSWPKGDEIIDVLVKPLGGILDLNSRFSGVWPTDLAEALPYSLDLPQTTSDPSRTNVTSSTMESGGQNTKKYRIVSSPVAARDLLFSHITPQTPLIGHGLENDLNATRVIHPVLIDTALLYPHKAGLPYRNGLKALMAQHLNRQIQVVVDGDMRGHDSKEDANAAGDLVRLRLKETWEQLKREGWMFVNGKRVKKGEGSGKENEYKPNQETLINGKKRERNDN